MKNPPLPTRLLLAWLPLLALLLVGCGREPATSADAWRTNDEFVRAVNRGVNDMNRYDFAAAELAYRDALALSPDSLEARVGLALATFNNSAAADGLERAAALLDEVLARDPDHLQGLYLRGLIHLTAGEPDAARERLQRVVAEAPHDAHAWYALARAKKQAGLSPEVELQRAIDENPELSSAYYELFQLLLREGPERQEEAARLQATFTALSAHPLGDQMDPSKYGQMGPLGVARPLAAAPPALSGEALVSFDAEQVLFARAGSSLLPPDRSPLASSSMAAGDVDSDGDLDLLTLLFDSAAASSVTLLRNDGPAGLVDIAAEAGLAGLVDPLAFALGDYDNDGRLDLFVACGGENRLLRGDPAGGFTDVTASTGTGGSALAVSRAAVFLDADHDADLDLYVCNASGPEGASAANQLLRNNSDGTFSDIAQGAGLACPAQRSVALAPVDLDDDRDTDLLVFHEDAPISFFRNDLLAGYSEFDPIGQPVDGSRGGVAQDFDGDGLPDLLVFATPQEPLRLFLGRSIGPLQRSTQLDGVTSALPPGSSAGSTRIADIDLDGDLDIVLLGGDPSWLANDGRGRFALRKADVSAPSAARAQALDAFDFSADGRLDLLACSEAAPERLLLLAGRLAPPAHWLGLSVTGQHSQAYSTRSPVSGYGTKVEVRAGLHAQTITHTGLYGGPSQSTRPLVFGLDGAVQADYIYLRWPDAITQSETGLEADSYHVLAEMQRRPTSCPMLFAWDGERFGFVGDFAGVGGLGYYAGPGAPPAPQVKELVRIDASQLAERDGLLQLRACEPMEEVAYLDRLELLAVDHPADHLVYPDDRLTVSGPAPSQELLQVGARFFPLRAEGPDGAVDPASLRELDRVYAYSPPLDRRFFGYCHEHTLVLEFGRQLRALEPGRPTYLFLGGSLEYPYSQTNFAAQQAGLAWNPPRLELLNADGDWVTLVADAGAPGGMARTIAVDLSGLPPAGEVTLRLVSNLELYYDRVFIAQDLGRQGLEVRSAPMLRAELSRLGFPQEYSPDGRNPRIYTYDFIEASFGFRRLRGAYTRYGDVKELLGAFDDRYVVMATGDEVAVDFDATALPPVADGCARTYVLMSHAYCKDMDLHSFGPGTVEPLPFAAMSGYPYPDDEGYPWNATTRAYHEQYNTRIIR